MGASPRVAAYRDINTSFRLVSRLPGARIIPVRAGRVRIGTVVYFQADRTAYAYSRESTLLGRHSWCRDAIDHVRDHWRSLA